MRRWASVCGHLAPLHAPSPLSPLSPSPLSLSLGIPTFWLILRRRLQRVEGCSRQARHGARQARAGEENDIRGRRGEQPGVILVRMCALFRCQWSNWNDHMESFFLSEVSLNPPLSPHPHAAVSRRRSSTCTFFSPRYLFFLLRCLSSL